MIIVGEKLNSSIPKTLEAMNAGDVGTLTELIRRQEQGGADYLDVNTALCEAGELDRMLWVIGLVLEHSECGIMLDSPSGEILASAAKSAGKRRLIFNSVTLKTPQNTLETVARAAVESGAGVVIMPVGESFPHSSGERILNAEKMVKILTGLGVPAGNLYVDAIVETVSADGNAPSVTLETIRGLKARLPEVRSVCGVSNVSFGLPGRANLNAAFLAMASAAGLDCAILDTTSDRMCLALRAAAAIAGEDEFCMEYIAAMRSRQNA